MEGTFIGSDFGAELVSQGYYSTVADDAKDDLLTPRYASNEKRSKRPTKKNSSDEQRPVAIDVDAEIDRRVDDRVHMLKQWAKRPVG